MLQKDRTVDELRRVVGSEDTAAIGAAIQLFAVDQQQRLNAECERRMLIVNKYLEQAAEELYAPPSLERLEPIQALLMTARQRSTGHGVGSPPKQHTSTMNDASDRLISLQRNAALNPAETLVELLDKIDNGNLAVF